MKEHIHTGESGERIACNYLKRRAYIVLERNWRYSRAEIDIIAKKGDLLVFVEVKTRTSTFFGKPESFVNKRKKALIVDAANTYMYKRQYCGEFRFDIIAILMKNQRDYAIKHLKDAFFPGFEGFI